MTKTIIKTWMLPKSPESPIHIIPSDSNYYELIETYGGNLVKPSKMIWIGRTLPASHSSNEIMLSETLEHQKTILETAKEMEKWIMVGEIERLNEILNSDRQPTREELTELVKSASIGISDRPDFEELVEAHVNLLLGQNPVAFGIYPEGTTEEEKAIHENIIRNVLRNLKE